MNDRIVPIERGRKFNIRYIVSSQLVFWKVENNELWTVSGNNYFCGTAVTIGEFTINCSIIDC